MRVHEVANVTAARQLTSKLPCRAMMIFRILLPV